MIQKFEIIYGKTPKNQKRLIKQLFHIDNVCYGKINKNDMGSQNSWYKIIKQTYDHIVFLNNKPIGYIDFVLINKKGVEKIKRGTIKDGELDGIIKQKRSGGLDLYLVSICILPKYRKLGLAKKLWNTSRLFFKKKKYNIKNIYAVIWSAQGKKFLSGLNKKSLFKNKLGRETVEINCKGGLLPKM